MKIFIYSKVGNDTAFDVVFEIMCTVAVPEFKIVKYSKIVKKRIFLRNISYKLSENGFTRKGA